MTQLLEAPAEVALMRVSLRCSYILKDGKRRGEMCNRLLAELDVEEFRGVIAIKCKCGETTEFR